MTRLSRRALAVASLPAILTGCGSVSGTKDYARIRAVDAAVNAATANVLVNGSSANGDLTQGQATSYLYIGTGKSSFGFTTTATLPAGATPVTGPDLDLSNGQFYSVFLLGRYDVPVRSTTYLGVTDPRFLQVVVLDDAHPAAASGQALVRVIDAAPDAGPVDVLTNGAVPDTAFAGVGYVTPTTTYYNAPYVSVAAGSVSVQVNNGGASTIVIPARTVGLAAGKAYTLIVQESPTATGTTFTPTYTVQLISDNN